MFKRKLPSVHFILPVPEVGVPDALLARGQVEVEGGHVVEHAVQRLLRVLLCLADL